MTKKLFKFRSKNDSFSLTRGQMLFRLRMENGGDKKWFKKLGFNTTKEILDDDLYDIFGKTFSLKIDKRTSNNPNIVDGDIKKIRNFNAKFEIMTSMGRELFTKLKEEISNLVIDYSFSQNLEYDHDNYTDKPIDRLDPLEFMVWLTNFKKRLEKRIKVYKDVELEKLYKQVGEIWDNTNFYALGIAKNKLQLLLMRNNIPLDISKNKIENNQQFLYLIDDIKTDYPNQFDKIKDEIESTPTNRGISWFVNNSKEVLISYIETFYKKELPNFFTRASALKASKQETRERTLKIFPKFNEDSYLGVVGQLYEDLLDLAFRAKLGIISSSSFISEFNKKAKSENFKFLVSQVGVKNLYRFNFIAKKNHDKYNKLLDKPNINRAMMKLHCFNVASIILNHFKISQSQVPLRMNMISAIDSYEKGSNWVEKVFNKKTIDSVTDKELEDYFYKIFDLDKNFKVSSKFINVSKNYKKWAPVDYVLGGKPISLKRQQDISKIKLKSGGSISGDSGNMANKLRGMLKVNHKNSKNRAITNDKLKEEILEVITTVLFRNNHYLVVVSDKQLIVFDFSNILNNIDTESLVDVSEDFLSNNMGLSSNVFKVHFKTLSPIKATFYSLSDADNVLSKLRRGLSTKNGKILPKEKFSSTIRSSIKGNSDLLNNLFELKINFEKGKEYANLKFLVKDKKINITTLSQLENKNFMPDFDNWLNKIII